MSEHQALKLLHQYWERRSAFYDSTPNYSDTPDIFGRNIVASYLRKLQPQSLIEVGCGNGQLFSTYTQIPRVVACDWSTGMLSRAKTRVERHGYGNITLKQLDITKEALPERFDVALTRTVLMHIPKENVMDACSNLAKMSDTLMLFEFYDPQTPPLDWHCFHHEYPVYLDRLGYKIAELYDRPDGIRQVLMVYRKVKKDG